MKWTKSNLTDEVAEYQNLLHKEKLGVLSQEEVTRMEDLEEGLKSQITALLYEEYKTKLSEDVAYVANRINSFKEIEPSRQDLDSLTYDVMTSLHQNIGLNDAIAKLNIEEKARQLLQDLVF